MLARLQGSACTPLGPKVMPMIVAATFRLTVATRFSLFCMGCHQTLQVLCSDQGVKWSNRNRQGQMGVNRAQKGWWVRCWKKWGKTKSAQLDLKLGLSFAKMSLLVALSFACNMHAIRCDQSLFYLFIN